MLNLDGISDGLALTLAHELNLHRRVIGDASTSNAQRQQSQQSQQEDSQNACQCRLLLAKFASSHPQAERALSRLILKHIGISRSVLRDQHYIPVAKDNNSTLIPINDVTTARSTGTPSSISEDLIPPLCPIPWLSQSAWDAIPYNEKVELMEMAILGLSHPSATVRYRMYPSTSQYSDSFVMFGRGSVERVVFGHGPRHVLVLVGIHGNEPCGVEAARLILQRHCLFTRRSTAGSSSSGLLATKEELDDNTNWTIPLASLSGEITIEFVVGNPKAVAANKRFLQRNLNRLLDVHVLCDETIKEDGYEIQRARVVYEAIRHSDAVLDIHSVSSDSDPFAIPASTDASEELAQQLPVSYVVESLAHCTAEGGTSMDCALVHDVPAVCVECGQHSHVDIVARAADVISTFLLTQYGGEKPSSRSVESCASAGLANEEKKDAKEEGSKDSKGPVVMRCEGIEIVREGFEWMKPFQEFEWIPYGVAVFKDSVRGEVTCPVKPGSYLVMPTKIPIVGEEALSWARATGAGGENVAVSEESQ